MIETLFPLGTVHYLIGGLLVGMGISLPFVCTGLVAGASTVFTSSWSYFFPGWFFQQEGFVKTRSWRIALVLGFVTGGFIYFLFVTDGVATVTKLDPLRLLVGGFIIGIGTRMSGGCASGHGICGIASLEKVSVLATIVFLVVAIVVARLTSVLFSL